MNWIDELRPKERRGSRPRCLAMIHADRAEVAHRLTGIVNREFVTISPLDIWMPFGVPIARQGLAADITPTCECKLTESQGFLDEEKRAILRKWWLANSRAANTPNWDIASTCMVDGRRGLLLVEAKAHSGELSTNGVSKAEPGNERSERNRETIKAAVDGACGALSQLGPGWGIRCDSHYQLANRFAWSWKIASLGMPVVLVYLGFLKADEMPAPFADDAEWRSSVLRHSRTVVPSEAWEATIKIENASLTPLIRSLVQPLTS